MPVSGGAWKAAVAAPRQRRTIVVAFKMDTIGIIRNKFVFLGIIYIMYSLFCILLE